MPAAAVIPAPIAYTNFVAVKKLVVGFLVGAASWFIELNESCWSSWEVELWVLIYSLYQFPRLL